MKAFIINLAKNKDRREYMHNMLTEYGLEHEFVDGLYGREADDKFISQIYDSKKSIEVNGQDLSRAEIGCAYSHTLVYKKIVEQNLIDALVLEDDVYLDSTILDVITLLESTKHKRDRKSVV